MEFDLSIDDFRDWQRHPVTKHLYDIIEVLLEERQKSCVDQDFLDSPLIHLKAQRCLGEMLILQLIKNLDLDYLEESFNAREESSIRA